MDDEIFDFSTTPLDHEKAKEWAELRRYEELTYCGSEALDFKTGGVGVTIYFSMLKYWGLCFFFMTLVSIPIYFYQLQLYNLSVVNYSAQHFAYIDILSYGSIYNYLDANVDGPLRESYTQDSTTYYRIVGDQGGLINYVYFLDSTEKWYTQWKNLFVACTWLATMIYYIFYQCWLGKVEVIKEEVDASMVSPADFSLEVKGIPKDTKDGVFLAFMDALTDRQIWETPVNYWETDVATKLNEDWSLKKQQFKLLYNKDSPHDMKVALTVKKLDRSIYDFIALADICDDIKRARTNIYFSNKKDKNSADVDEEAKKLASYGGGSPALDALYDSYHEKEEALKVYREGKPGYNDIETLYGIVSFRTESFKYELIEEYERVYNCYTLKFKFCCCCFSLNERWHFKDQDGVMHPIKLQHVKGEPGDYRWENIYVHPVEKTLRYCLYFLFIVICLLISLGSMVAAVSYQNTLPKGVDCSLIQANFETYDTEFKADWSALSGESGYVAFDGSLTDPYSMPIATYSAWRTIIKEHYSVSSGDLTWYSNLGTLTKTEIKDSYDETFYCYCTQNASTDSICSDDLITEITLIVIPLAITIGVALLNFMIYVVIVSGIEITRPVSNSVKLSYMVLFMSISYFINMGMIPVITGGNFAQLTADVFGVGAGNAFYDFIESLGDSKPEDINSLWYTIVGLQIMSNLFINSVSPNISAFATVVMTNTVGYCKICCDAAGTQEDLQELYLGPEYLMHTQYSYFLNHIALCIVFGPGMPVLYPIALVATFFLYNVDKYALIKVYRKPLDISDEVNNTGNLILYAVLILNIIWATWTYSNPMFFNTDTYSTASLMTDGEYVLDSGSKFIARFVSIKNILSLYDASSAGNTSEVEQLAGQTFSTLAFNLLLVLIVLWTVAKNSIVTIFCWIFCCTCCKKNTIAIQGDEEDGGNSVVEEPLYTNEFVKNPVFNYSVYDNDYYKKIINTLQAMDKRISIKEDTN